MFYVYQKGLLGVAAINCNNVACEDLREDGSQTLVYLEKVHGVWTTNPLKDDTPSHVMSQVLDLLPSVPELDSGAFRVSSINIFAQDAMWLTDKTGIISEEEF